MLCALRFQENNHFFLFDIFIIALQLWNLTWAKAAIFFFFTINTFN